MIQSRCGVNVGDCMSTDVFYGEAILNKESCDVIMKFHLWKTP